MSVEQGSVEFKPSGMASQIIEAMEIADESGKDQALKDLAMLGPDAGEFAPAEQDKP